MNIPRMFDLTEKIALISGASRGIGAAIAQTLADFGAEVILTSRRIENLNEVESQLKESGKKVDRLFELCKGNRRTVTIL